MRSLSSFRMMPLLRTLAVGLVAAVVLGFAYRLHELSSVLARRTRVLEEVRVRRFLVGGLIDLEHLANPLRERIQATNQDTLTAILVLPKVSCLVCYAELPKWKRLSTSLPALRVIVVLVGSPTELASSTAREEALPFPVLADPDSSLPRALGVSPGGPLRILLVGRRIVLISDAPEDGPIGFTDAIQAIARL